MASRTEPATDRVGDPASRSAFRDRGWWAALIKSGFGASFWAFLVFAVATGAACYLLLGPAAFTEAVRSDLAMIAGTVPRIVAALMVAALLWVMLPRDRITALVGRESGTRGLIVATLAGMVTPGGPSSAYALLAVLGAAGADRGALIAYITSWGMLGLQRILIWDVPFMGAEFSATRFLISLPLPIVAGLIARQLPLALTIEGPPGSGDREDRR